jgi:hypothetical protein
MSQYSRGFYPAFDLYLARQGLFSNCHCERFSAPALAPAAPRGAAGQGSNPYKNQEIASAKNASQ